MDRNEIEQQVKRGLATDPHYLLVVERDPMKRAVAFRLICDQLGIAHSNNDDMMAEWFANAMATEVMRTTEQEQRP